MFAIELHSMLTQICQKKLNNDKFYHLLYPDILYRILLHFFFGNQFFVSKRIDKNPNVLPKDDSAYAFVGHCFKVTLASLFLYSISLPFFHDLIFIFQFAFLDLKIFKYLGISMMIFSLIGVFIAQLQMHNSWRIGIDEDLKTELINTGLFSISRNPVFLGMTIALVGFVLTVPSIITFFFLIVSHILIQIQIRLEEEFLLKQQGKSYLNYKNKVRRMI